jgi:hypothetical protein
MEVFEKRLREEEEEEICRGKKNESIKKRKGK